MKLYSLLEKNYIFCKLRVKDKDELYDLILNKMKDDYAPLKKETLLKSLYERETIGSIIFGDFALPHARIQNLNKLLISMAILEEPIEVQGKMVSFVIFILNDISKSKIYLQTLKAFAKLFLDKDNIEKMRNCKNAQALLECIKEKDIQVSEYLVANDIMSDKVICISKERTVYEAINLMFQEKITGIAVLDECNKFVGLVTATAIIDAGIPDYIRRLDNISFLHQFEPFEELLKNEKTMKVSEVTQPAQYVAKPDSSVIELALAIVDKDLKRIPVCNEDNELVGIITRTDIIKKVIVG